MNILDQFGVQPVLLAAQVVNFLILLFILKKFLYKPILKVLEERKQKIAQGLKNAEEIEKRLLKIEENKDKIFSKTIAEAQKILDEAKKDIASMKNDAKIEADKQTELLVKKGQEAILIEKQKMQDEIKAELSTVVILALQKVTGKVLKQKDQKEIIEEAIKELKK